MSQLPERDELIERLAAEDTSSRVEGADPTLIEFKAELETLQSQIRQPEPADPFADESECEQLVEKVAEMGRDLSAGTRAELERQEVAAETPALGTLGQYQLIAKLGEGGMGAVYKAVHTRLERVVALKVLPKERMLDHQAVARFQREMRAVGKLQHPNIVGAHDAGEIDGTHYLVMELVEGTDLGKLVSEHGPLPINAACELIRQAALGLQHAYEHNLVHRDIKPSNLMLAAPVNAKASPTVKILDLGLALLEGSHIDAAELTSTGQVMGTLDYMAPEQGTDTHSVDIRADIYSLGASLYKLLTGRAPFGEPQYNSPIKKLMALANQAPKPVESLRPDCPPALSQLIARMLSKSPEERPTPPDELATLLEPFAQGADLHALLKPASQASTVHRQEMTVRTQHTADDPTFVPTGPVDAAAATRVASTISAVPPRAKRRLMLGLTGVAAALVMGVAIWIATDRGTVAIEASDDLAEQIQVKLLRDGAEYNPNWRIVPGKTNLTSVRSGKVEILLPDDGNEYELIKPAELVVRRGKSVVFKLSRIDKNAAAVAAVQTAVAPDYELDISGKTEAGFARVEIPDELPLDGPCTVEMYATPRSVAPIGFNEGFFSSVGGLTLKIADKDPQEPGKTGKTWQLAYATSAGPPDVIQSGPVEPGRRVHLAGVFTRDKLKFFLDGRLVATTRLSKPPARPAGMVSIGYNTTSENWRIFDGTVDEVRISTVARYVNDFTPAPRFESDDQTWGLYHCDEGSGTVLKDASGHGHDGSVIGATWKLRSGSNAAGPNQINEPPSLADWLKGRKRLTVAQDGKAEFTTISAALKALKPGQVVQVLDKGPYLERLELLSVPADVGLISEARTIIEVKELKDAGWQSGGVDVYEAHHLFDLDGFRLHGFHFVFPDASEQIHGPGGFQCCGFKVGRPGGLVVENCRFEGHCPAFTWDSLGLAFMENSSTRPVCVRDCVIEGGLRSDSTPTAEPPTVLITRNYLWKLTDERPNVKIYGGSFGKLGLHRNIFDGQAKGADLAFDAKIEDLEIRNNTLNSQKPIMFHQIAPGTVTIENNLCTKPGIVVFSEAPEDEYQRAAKTWRVGHNSYPRPIDAAHSLGKGDLSVRETLLSYEREDRNYLRLAASAASAKGGVGGIWPQYIGALTPGPAPTTGDWFTRLRERWFELPSVAPKPASPQQPEEPPPLAEWLKGRKVLTVAQDGSGQFKTIQSALETVHPGQVVKVLDPGPYRERLKLRLPENVGLVSECGTTIELAAWDNTDSESYGHRLTDTRGFRLSGIQFSISTQPEAALGYLCVAENSQGLVVENCAFIGPDAGKPIFGLYARDFGPDIEVPLVVRENLFDFSELRCFVSSGARAAPVIIERNYIRQPRTGSCIYIQGPHRRVFIWQNILTAGSAAFGITVQPSSGQRSYDSLQTLEICNNTIPSPGMNAFTTAAPSKNVKIQNNILVPFKFLYGAEEEDGVTRARENWTIGQNCHAAGLDKNPRAGTVLSSSPNDLAIRPEFLSEDRSERDYLRIPANSQLANAGKDMHLPRYIGALKPGPAPSDGDWFTRLGERWLNPPAVPVTATKPTLAAEPAPLADWLEGRTVLTVAQDGSGQFKTIQAAFEAIQPGQVVKVLDKGPYRERLRLNNPPADVGLISDQQAVLELPDWEIFRQPAFDYRFGHNIQSARGFRLSGFALVATSDGTEPPHSGVYFQGSEGVVVEDCKFVFADIQRNAHVWHKGRFAISFSGFGGDVNQLSVVRDCVLDGGLGVTCWPNRIAAPILFTRNLIRPWGNGTGILVQGWMRKVFLRNNLVLAAPPSQGFQLRISPENSAFESIDVTHNTVVGPAENRLQLSLPNAGVTICANVLLPFRLAEGAEKNRAGRDQCKIASNWYHVRPESMPDSENLVFRRPDDPVVEPKFLSVAPADRNFARLVAMEGVAIAGALPAGPAPQEGDWFTRLCERWGELKPSRSADERAPTLIPEPQSVAEWLKGRTVLTVAQDGTGQFKTIQSAIEAFRRGQVIKVLDRGPYRERLDRIARPDDARLALRTLDDKDHPWAPPADLDSWKIQAETIRERMLVSNGLWPMLPKSELKPVIHGRIDRDDYTVEKVYFASLPGHYVTGNLYRPKKITGKAAGVLCPYGHWANGRFYDAGEQVAREQMAKGAEKLLCGAQFPLQARMVQLARMGCVVFQYDMIGYGDSRSLEHREGFNDVDAELRLQNVMGLQTFNSIRALDFLTSLPEVDSARIGVTGESGGGTQTMMLCGVDPRPATAFPAVMVSAGMQGGCVCENASYLRIGLNNVALAAAFAPKPLAMSGADDWTRDIETRGFPELRQVYTFYGKPELVAAKAFPQFEHNFNQVAREMMYAWFAQHLGLDPARGLTEREFNPIQPAELSVYDANHPQPADAADTPRVRESLRKMTIEQYNQLRPHDAASLTEYRRIVGTAARVMLDTGVPSADDVEFRERGEVLMPDGVLFRRLIVSRRGAGEQVPLLVLIPENANGMSVLWIDGQWKGALFSADGKPIPPVQKLLSARMTVATLDPFLTGDALPEGRAPQIAVDARNAGLTYCYNRPVLAQRVRDILTGVAALQRQPGVNEVRLIGMGDAGPWALLARALATEEIRHAVVDLHGFTFDRVTELNDPMMLPGALRYGGICGLAAIAAPVPLIVAGTRDVAAGELRILTEAYEAAGAKVEYEPGKLTPDRAVELIVK